MLPVSGAFPRTRVSLLHALASHDAVTRQRAEEVLAAAYWKPVYKYIRLKWNASREDAEDWTQEFFGDAFGKRWFSEFDPALARFRTFVRVCVDRKVANAMRAEQRIKRGGDARMIAIDASAAEAELASMSAKSFGDADELFRREWARSVFELSVARLRESLCADGKERHFAIFARYDLHAVDGDSRPTYAELAREFVLPETQITNFLALARRRFRQHVLDILSDLTETDRELADEARQLLGISA